MLAVSGIEHKTVKMFEAWLVNVQASVKNDKKYIFFAALSVKHETSQKIVWKIQRIV